MDFTILPPEEIERRRQDSIEELGRRDRAQFQEWYQEICDTEYWKHGKCCAGCDHWRSDAGMTGQCTASTIVSGADVLLSMGIRSCSLVLPPGHPFTRSDFVCGQFKDDFDWRTLSERYLHKIGAMRDGKLRDKPPMKGGA